MIASHSQIELKKAYLENKSQYGGLTVLLRNHGKHEDG